MLRYRPERALLAHPYFCSIVNNGWLWEKKLKIGCPFKFVNVPVTLEKKSIHIMVIQESGKVVAWFIGMITTAEFFKDFFHVCSIGMTGNVVTEDFLYSEIENTIKFMAIFFKQRL